MRADEEEIAAIVGSRGDGVLTFGGRTTSEVLAQFDVPRFVVIDGKGGLSEWWPPSTAPTGIDAEEDDSSREDDWLRGIVHCSKGIVQRGLRQGTWIFQRGSTRFEVSFVDDQPTAVPPGWRDEDWPRAPLISPEAHAAEVDAVQLVLHEYRQPKDAQRIAAELDARGYGRMRTLRTLMWTLGISLPAARCLLEMRWD
jgi:hypothetical protein